MEIGKLIRRALANTEPHYVVRDAGSFVAGFTRDKKDHEGAVAIRDWLSTLNWTECTDTVRADGKGFGLCRYGEVFGASADAFECIAEWQTLTDAEKAAVVTRRSPHASSKTGHINELLLPSVKPTRTSRIFIAVGNGEDPFSEPSEPSATVFLWAPGRCTRFTIISDEMSEDRSLIPPWATVKLGA